MASSEEELILRTNAERGEFMRDLIMDFIVDFTAKQGYNPTMDQIGEGVGLRARSTVFKHLQRLEHEGLLRKTVRGYIAA